ncbi:isochorismatase family protein [Methylobacterium sp. J-076]|uniref:isochorismatase family protein n=1 Tax=Methylobacterium sp. J-076 TaxID=2836655 RepID=UPI001FB88F9C|nr:isochorismatase family protein [Methylobacterium sp. J-076]MCJ2012807.1 isochorismatase family protein [Methylobacterium sp. J-076]
MPPIDPARSLLVLIDLQARLVPAIAEAGAVVANAGRLREAAALLGVPLLLTEQNPAALGPTVPELAGGETVAKMEFDVTRSEGFLARLPAEAEVILAGCEAHICVLQTALGLMAAGRRVRIVRDAVGSRRTDNREAALSRLAAHGADIVTTEMVVFEWLGSAAHPRFRDVVRLIK